MFRKDLLSIIRSLITVFAAMVFVLLVMLTVCSRGQSTDLHLFIRLWSQKVSNV